MDFFDFYARLRKATNRSTEMPAKKGPRMRTVNWLRLGLLSGATMAVGTGACGSSDGSRKAACAAGSCVDGGDGTGGRTDSSVDPTPSTGGANVGGRGAGGAAGSNAGGGAGSNAGGGPSDAGNGGSSSDAGTDGGSSPPCGSGVVDAGADPCAPGTADCDAEAGDCETDITTSATNCGRCNRRCGATAACTNGLCEPTVILDPPAGVDSNWCGAAFSATKAYMITCWGNNDLSEVRVAPLEPGVSVDGTRIRHYTDVTVVALRGILIDGNDVYYGLEGKPGVASNLWKFPLDADDTSDVTVGVTMEVGIRFDDLKLVGDTYYWEDNNHTAGGQIAGSTIYKRAKTDSSSTVLVGGLGLAYNLQVTDTKLVWLEARQTSSSVRAYRAPLAGAPLADVEEVGPATGGSYMTRQGDHVYWTVKSGAPDGKILRLDYANGAAVPEEVATGLTLPEGIVTDSQYVYFKQLDALYRVPLCGGTPEQLSPTVPAHDTQATAIYHVDDSYVYFAAGPGFGTSTLVRVAK